MPSYADNGCSRQAMRGSIKYNRKTDTTQGQTLFRRRFDSVYVFCKKISQQRRKSISNCEYRISNLKEYFVERIVEKSISNVECRMSNLKEHFVERIGEKSISNSGLRRKAFRIADCGEGPLRFRISKFEFRNVFHNSTSEMLFFLPKSEIRHPKCSFQCSSHFELRNPKFEIRNPKSEMLFKCLPAAA